MANLFQDQSNTILTDVSDIREPLSQYKVGDVVCGKVGKYPWWPCMVCPSEHSGNIDENNMSNSDIKSTEYIFVRYFGRLNEVSWLHEFSVINIQKREQYKMYISQLHSSVYKKEKNSLYRYRREIDKAWEEAECAILLSPEDRLRKYIVNYSELQTKLKSNRKRSKQKIFNKTITPHTENKQRKLEKKSLVYAFSELDFPFSSVSVHNKCCRYCLVANRTATTCRTHCGSNFHKSCVDELKLDLEMFTEDGDKCIECCLNYKLCFACSNEIKENDEQVSCSMNLCNKIYHRSCLEDGQMSEMTRKTLFDKLICPRHLCHHCELVEKTPKFSCSKLVFCLMCAATYHTGDWCIPVGSIELSKTDIICPRHLPCGEHVSFIIPPYAARIKSAVQLKIYGDIDKNISEAIIIPGNKKNKKLVNVNWCFKCGKNVEGKLICCESCPAAYHYECVDINTTPDNFQCLDCKSGNYHTYGEIVWIKCGNYRWWPGQIMHIENVPNNILNMSHNYGQFVVQFFGTHEYLWTDHGRVFTFEEGDEHSLKGPSTNLYKKIFAAALKEADKGFQEKELAWNNNPNNVALKSKKYIRIKVNRPMGDIKRSKSFNLSSYPVCDCTYFNKNNNQCNVGSDCINIQLKYECHPSLCKMREKCKNQNFVQRNYPKQEVYCSAKCGWGLKAVEGIKKHQFVNEYVGEIIDFQEAERRREWAKENNITDFYFMELDNNRLIDARAYSNLSRFMNHSCNPNLRAEKWIVQNDQRIGLFALKDIKAGEELTFNYNLYTQSSNDLPCFCGSSNCSGSLGEPPKKLDKKTKAAVTIKREKIKAKRFTKKFDLNAIESNSKGSITNSVSTVSLCTIKSVDKQCFRCSEDCNELTEKSCSLEFCAKIYHWSCLDLPRNFDNPRWICPWHHCDMCGKTAHEFCQLCTMSLCSLHSSADNFKKISSNKGVICMNHHDD